MSIPALITLSLHIVNVGQDFVSKVASLFTTNTSYKVSMHATGLKKNKFQLVPLTNSFLILLACGSYMLAFTFCNLINRHPGGKSTCSRQPSGTYF